MTDKESYVNVADLKRKLRAFAKYRQYSKSATDELLGVVSKLKISIKADLETTLESTDVQPVKHGRWITKAEDYYKAWQDSDRSWDDMPYFVTGLKFACSNCFEQFDVNAEGVEKWNGCPLCLARMDGETE